MLPFSFHPQLKAKNSFALPALVQQTPVSTSFPFTSALTSFNPLILAPHPGSWFPLVSLGDLSLPLFPRLPAGSSSEETPLSRYVSEQQQLTTFGAVSERLH